MLAIIISAFALVFVTIWVHAGGIAIAIRPLTRIHNPTVPRSFWDVVLIVHRIMWLVILLHLAEITIWAIFFWWRGCFPTPRDSLYFSGVTYTTVGYGDLVLAAPWRLIAPLESLMGALMFGLSTGVFFYVVSRIHNLRLTQYAASTAEQPKEP